MEKIVKPFAFYILKLSPRVVKVDPDSVNCVTIDDDPRNNFSRLMVASFIGLNPAGNTMVARNTTILPQIPGLPALATLLFAPYTEYRYAFVCRIGCCYSKCSLLKM